ncbi:WD40 repeat domain-containing protein [Nocardiopsis sp. NPDC058631]|uniref:WD40 repeat domain-containing protein n=1 Tax=Nocardiopsis sp. NPDC058631 TaxID=3346566 RepID=UPI00364E431D
METLSPRVPVPLPPLRTIVVRPLLTISLALSLGASCASPTADDADSAVPPRSVTDLDAEERARLADTLASRSLELAAEDPRLSTALALEAAGLERTGTSAAAMERLAEPHLIMELDSDGERLTSLVFSYEGRFLAGGTARGRVFLWDVYTGDTVFDEQAPGPVAELALDLASRLVAVRSGEEVLVWDVDSGAEETRIDVDSGSGMAFVSSLRGSLIDAEYLALGSGTGNVLLWNRDGWGLDGEIPAARERVSLAMSSHATVLATLTDEGEIGLWEVSTRELLGTADLRESGVSGQGFRFAPSAVGPDTIAVTSDEGVFAVSSEAVRSGDGPVTMPQSCSGVFCDKPSTRPSAHQRLDTVPGPAAQGNVRFLISAGRGRGFDELTLWETPPGTLTDYQPVETMPMARAVELLAASRTATDLHVVATVVSGSGPLLWDMDRDPHPPYADAESLSLYLSKRCLGAPVLLSPEEWDHEFPDLAYEPVCVRIQDEEGADHHEDPAVPGSPDPIDD